MVSMPTCMSNTAVSSLGGAAPDPSDSGAPALPTDEALAKQAQAGDKEAFGLLAERHAQEIARLLWRFSGNQEETRDLTQDVFVRVIRGLPGWRGEQPFLHWLRRITVNVGRDYCRRRGVRQAWQAPVEMDGLEAPHERVADLAPDPSARAAMKEVRELLLRVSPQDRIILTLHYLEGWSLEEIARAHGWPVPLMKLKSFRARKRFGKLLEETL